MAEVTVRELADQVGIPVERLLSQLGEAGLEARSADATISDDDKATLLNYLRTAQGRAADEPGAPAKITLTRKSHSQIKLPATSAGTRGPRQTRTVTVEVRRRRTYVHRSVVEAEEQRRDAEVLEEVLQDDVKRAEEEARLRAEEEARLRAEEEARRAEEEARAAEEEARRKAEEEAKAQEAVAAEAAQEPELE